MVVGIRCHEFGENEFRLYDLLKSVFDLKSIYFILDNREIISHEQVREIQVIKVNEIASYYNPPNDWGWRCGDFFYYAFRKMVSCEYYCLIEPDATFTPKTAKKLFALIEENKADLMAFNISKAGAEWYWHKTIAPICGDVYKCAFPFTILSGKAIDYLEKLRVSTASKFANKTVFANDEAFVASRIISSNLFSYFNLNSIPWIRLNKFSTTNVYPLHLCTNDDHIYHSALPFSQFVKKLSGIIAKCQNHDQINSCLTFSLSNSDREFIEKIKLASNDYTATAITIWDKNNLR